MHHRIIMSASPYAAVKVSCLVASYPGSSDDKTGIIEGEICFADTDPDSASVLQCSPRSSLALCLLRLLHCKNLCIETRSNTKVELGLSGCRQKAPTRRSAEHPACSRAGGDFVAGLFWGFFFVLLGPALVSGPNQGL